MPELAELYSASDSDPAPVVGFLQELVALYDLPRPPHVLDVGCGPGRLLEPLARLRWHVTGMEPNPDFLAAARARAAASRHVTVRQGGFLDVDQRGCFDLVAAINSSFAHLLVPAERALALRRVHDALRPGGVVCVDLPNFLWILKHYRAPEPYAFTARGQPVTLLRRHDVDYRDAILTTIDEYRLDGDGTLLARLVHRYGMVTTPEMEHHLHEAGFTELRAFDGYDPRPGSRLDGPRMVLTARTPAA